MVVTQQVFFFKYVKPDQSVDKVWDVILLKSCLCQILLTRRNIPIITFARIFIRIKEKSEHGRR